MAKGGARPGAGRKAGADSPVKKALAELAKAHAPEALKTLASIAKDGEQESSRVAASIAILDRAYGKPHQTMAVSAEVTTLTQEQRLKQLADGTYGGG